MSTDFDIDRVIEETYAEMLRCYANPETREKARQHRRFLADHNLGMSLSRAKGKADSIVFMLTDRFGFVSSSLEERLYSLSDIAQLNELTKLALRSNSLEEFESGLT